MEPPEVAVAVSIVIPAFNEEENIPLLAAELRSALAAGGVESYEVVLVDDGSTDATGARIREEVARDTKGRFRLLKLERNSGESAAMEAGLRRARGDFLVVMDADLQNDPKDIPKLLEPVRRGEADCACGWRRKRGEGDSWFRRVQSRIANGIRNRLSGEAIHDSGCTFRAFRRECVERVKIFKGMHRFLPTLMKLEGYTVTEVEVESRPRVHGKSKYGMWNRAFAALYDLLAVRWMRKRVVPWRIAEDSLASPSAGKRTNR